MRSLEARGTADEPVLASNGRAITPDAINTLILCAAHDARIDRASEVDASVLRHTYIAYLVQQGIRFADLPRIVGQLPVGVLGAYATLSPTSSPVAMDAIDPVYPSAPALHASGPAE